jgi:hypothetical protein
MEDTEGLSLEQQFKLEVLKKEIDGLNIEQSREYLLQIFRQMMVHENLCRTMLKQCYL